MEELNKAVTVLKKGGVVICPTDTVYGFLADATNKKAVEKVYKIKKRPKSEPLPIFVKDLTMAKKVAVVDERAEKFLLNPKVTVVLKMRPKVKLYGMAKNHTVALRIPKYKFLNQLLKKVNKPLVQTSVNISNQPPLVKIKDIQKHFSNKNILIINGGNLKKAKPSAIIDLTNNKLKFLRK